MFITFEGIDASGKSTQISLLEKRLIKLGYAVLKTKQPGGTSTGMKIREILLDPDNRKLQPEAELLLYLADRIQHLRETILPALQDGKIVLLDRYHDATVAYQGAGRGLDLDWIKPLEIEFLIKPEVTFLLLITPEESQKRLHLRNRLLNQQNCRFENENLAFFQRIHQAYIEISEKESDRFVLLDGLETQDKIHERIFEILERKLAN